MGFAERGSRRASGMRRNPGGLRHRGYHDDVMIYRGGSSVPHVRADVLGEPVVY